MEDEEEEVDEEALKRDDEDLRKQIDELDDKKQGRDAEDRMEEEERNSQLTDNFIKRRLEKGKERNRVRRGTVNSLITLLRGG